MDRAGTSIPLIKVADLIKIKAAEVMENIVELIDEIE